MQLDDTWVGFEQQESSCLVNIVHFHSLHFELWTLFQIDCLNNEMVVLCFPAGDHVINVTSYIINWSIIGLVTHYDGYGILLWIEYEFLVAIPSQIMLVYHALSAC